MRIQPTRTQPGRIPSSRSRPTRVRICGLALAVSTVVAALAGCSASSQGALGLGDAAAAATPSPSQSLPGADSLQAALLSPDDLGANFSVEPSGSSSPSLPTGKGSGSGKSATGCEQLSDLINGSPQNGTPAPSSSPPGANRGANQGGEAQVLLNGGQVGPFVGEFLTARPQSVLDTTYPQVKNALASCKNLNLSTGGTTVDFRLSPVDFGSPGSVARRMDGTVQGVTVNGYFVVDRLDSNVAMIYLYIQVSNTSSESAYAYYQIAVSKAQDVLGISTSAAASV
ncbi:hypothetical protein [Streptacidiphilus fuscans]|uniref:Uncharacterized protein n=1 Tax=Streptacidiphilus fuscans TaxID=2789292 RepID=A0A931B3W5_9ACTN|nr:hypothetical protein [Streptacidiphilus fuscans]MBF9068491.1 hypothetical protein [Streptacidiphilus fuscans]